MSKQLSIAGFRAWLAGQAPSAVVGEAGDCCRCPIATYARHELGFPKAKVNYQTIYWQEFPFDEGPLPPWAFRFAEAIDLNPRHGKITARLALRVLNRVTRAAA